MKALPLVLVSLLLAANTYAAPRAALTRAAAVPATPFHAEFEANLADVEDKLLRLAQATPADRFNWRPANDVRSIAEVYTHIAAANYFLGTFLGASTPAAAEQIEKRVTKKADVIAELKKSFAHVRVAASAARDLEKRVKMFGSQTTQRGVLITMLNHLHEHLGQSIAYARMNGVAPPWSR